MHTQKGEQMTKYNIDELKTVVSGIGKMGTALDGAIGDGSIGLNDLDDAWELLKGLQIVLSVDFRQIVLEWHDLDESEKTELFESFKTEFDLDSDVVEDVVETLVGLAFELYGIIDRLSKLFK